MPGKDTNIGAKRARETRAELSGDPAGPLACLLTAVEDELGIPVVVAALPQDVAGACWRDGDRVVLWVNGTEPVVRQRFTLAHELGHVRCRHAAGVPVDTFETLAGRTTDAREIQANAFAAELLAPAAGVRAAVNGEPGLDDVARLAARSGMSTIAALIRFKTLGLLAEPAPLERAIEAGEQNAVYERLALPWLEDGLARVDPERLPRVPPMLDGSLLAQIAERAT